MPYKTNSDLPESVRNHLPEAAQTIFRKVFNAALKEYKDQKKRRDPHESAEAVAMQVAWAAVKKEYHKSEKSGHWVKNS